MGMTVQSMFMVPVPSEAQRVGGSRLQGTLQQLLSWGHIPSGVQEGWENQVGWWGRLAMTSLWGPGYSGPWRIV